VDTFGASKISVAIPTAGGWLFTRIQTLQLLSCGHLTKVGRENAQETFSMRSAAATDNNQDAI
jgi:gentisate 1,2-dioxygenase